MNKTLKFMMLIPVVTILWNNVANAQFTLSAEVRPRAEFRNGFKKPLESNMDAAFFVEQRTRLNTSFKSEKFDVFISLQDVRNWGAVSQVYKTDPTLHNIYEAWAAYNISSASKIAVGRMELDYDNVRILGNLDWASQGRSHDLVKYEYNGEGVKFHTGIAFNQDGTTPEFGKLTNTFYNVTGNYKTMQYAWFHKDWKGSGLSVLFLNNGVQAADSSVNFSQTFGFYGTKKLGEVALEYDAYYQFGKTPTGADLGAYMFGINATFWKTKPHNLSVGVDYLSGDKSNTTGKSEAFDPLYGTHHKFYGFMDYFYVGNGHAGRGLIDVFAKAKFKTGGKSVLLAQAHEFLAQTEIMGESAELSSTLGTEVDLVYVLKIAPEVTLNVGYSQLFYTESLETIKNVVDPKGASWAWAMITFKPTLFTTKTSE